MFKYVSTIVYAFVTTSKSSLAMTMVTTIQISKSEGEKGKPCNMSLVADI